jgi:hypothetical protein
VDILIGKVAAIEKEGLVPYVSDVDIDMLKHTLEHPMFIEYVSAS